MKLINLLKIQKLKFLIFGILLLINISIISADMDYYLVNFNYDYGDLSIGFVELKSSESELRFYYNEIENLEIVYTIKILDNNNNILDSGIFYFSDIVNYDLVNETFEAIYGGGSFELDEFTFDVNIPYYSNAAYIVIYDPNGNEIIRVDMGGNLIPTNDVDPSDYGGSVSLFWKNTFIVTNNQFENGYSKELEERQRLRVKINSYHYTGVIGLTETSAVINVSSDPQQVEFNINDEKRFDLNEDDYYDLIVRLNSIEDNKADVFVQSIYEHVVKKKLLNETEDIEMPKSGPDIMKKNWIYKNKLLVSLILTAIIVLVIVMVWKPFKVKSKKKTKRTKKILRKTKKTK